MSKDLQKLLSDCEDLIRAGRGAEVKSHLTGLNSAQLPRAFRLPFAGLGRRLNLNSLAMRLLAPAINPAAQPTTAESAEYAVLLQRLGALDEAEARLQSLEPQAHAHPEILLFQAFCRFNRWEYAEAILLLKRYLGSDLPEY